MAVTENTYTGNGSSTNYSFTFPYLETTDIKVSLNGTITTAYTLPTATTIQFNTAPANGVAIRIYRVTDDAALAAQFYPGSAIRAVDLNENFTQNLYVTQESNRDATSAISTANSATTTANTALSTANAATATANTASTNASAAVTTANTASTNASAAVSTANTASTNAATALSTANTAATNAATALSTANTALSTANTASTNATAAVSTANTASTNASSAVTTANTASSNASTAVTTANTAASNASTALSTANTAISTANAAASAVANAILYDLVANVAAIPGSPSNNDAVEVVDSTGIESFTPLAGKPNGFTGSSGLSVRIVYTTTGATWNWIQYFPNDPETRYLKTGTGTITSTNIADGTIVNADISATAAIAPSKISGTAVVDNDARLTDARTPTDGSVTNTKVNASAAIAGTKISPDFGSQNVTTTGTATAAALIPSGSSVPTNGVYLPSANNVGISTGGSGRLFINSSGQVGIGTTPGATLDVAPDANRNLQVQGKSGTTYGLEIKNGTANSAGELHVTAASSGSVVINRGTTEIARFSSTGLGIGSTSPSELLHVNGNVLIGTGNKIRTDSSSGGLTIQGGATFPGGHIVFSGGNASDNIVFNRSGASSTSIETARIDASGRLLVGTSTARSNFFNTASSAPQQFQVEGTSGNACSLASICSVADTSGGRLLLAHQRSGGVGGNTILNSGDQAGYITFQGNDGGEFVECASIEAIIDGTPGANSMPGRIVLSTTASGASSPTERMRIRADGIVAINRTGASPTSDPQQLFIGEGGTNAFAIMVMQTGGNNGTSRDYIRFYNYSNQLAGSIQHNGFTTVSYNTSSDYRLKENISSVSSPCNRLLRLKPCSFNFIAEPDKRVDGFIAHEVQEVIPEAINGEKDAVDADGNPVYQGIDQSKLVPLLTAALQEALQKIEDLEGRLTAAGF